VRPGFAQSGASGCHVRDDPTGQHVRSGSTSWADNRQAHARHSPSDKDITHMTDTFGQGRFRYRIDRAWELYPGDGPHGEAVGVACDSRGRVFVFLRGPSPVRIHEANGAFVTAWGADVFVRPHGIFIGPDDTVYCTDDFDHSVRAFTPEGRFAPHNSARLASRPTPARQAPTIARSATPGRRSTSRPTSPSDRRATSSSPTATATLAFIASRRMADSCARGASRAAGRGSFTFRTASHRRRRHRLLRRSRE